MCVCVCVCVCVFVCVCARARVRVHVQNYNLCELLDTRACERLLIRIQILESRSDLFSELGSGLGAQVMVVRVRARRYVLVTYPFNEAVAQGSHGCHPLCRICHSNCTHGYI